MRDEERGRREVDGIVVGRDLGAGGLEELAVAEGAVADEPPSFDLELLGRADARARR